MIRFHLQSLVLSCFLLMGLCLFSADVSRAAPSEARQELETTINAVLAELKKPELKNSATRNAVLGKVEGIINGLFSFEELSARTVGPSWSTFSPDQQRRFITAFTTLLRENYLEKLDGYNGESVAYVSEKKSSSGDKVEISTTVSIKGKPVPVAYRMLKKGKWVVYDVIIEGVSMVQNYRGQFKDMLMSSKADQLITQVQKKAEEARAYNQKMQTGK